MRLLELSLVLVLVGPVAACHRGSSQGQPEPPPPSVAAATTPAPVATQTTPAAAPEQPAEAAAAKTPPPTRGAQPVRVAARRILAPNGATLERTALAAAPQAPPPAPAPLADRASDDFGGIRLTPRQVPKMTNENPYGTTSGAHAD